MGDAIAFQGLVKLACQAMALPTMVHSPGLLSALDLKPFQPFFRGDMTGGIGGDAMLRFLVPSAYALGVSLASQAVDLARCFAKALLEIILRRGFLLLGVRDMLPGGPVLTQLIDGPLHVFEEHLLKLRAGAAGVAGLRTQQPDLDEAAACHGMIAALPASHADCVEITGLRQPVRIAVSVVCLIARLRIASRDVIGGRQARPARFLFLIDTLAGQIER